MGIPAGRRRFLFMSAGSMIWIVLGGSRRAWGEEGHGHKPGGVAPGRKPGSEPGAQAQGHAAETAPYGHGSRGKGPGKDEDHKPDADGGARGGSEPHHEDKGAEQHGHGGGGEGHAGHGHGEPAFERYGLVAEAAGYKEFNVRLERFKYEPGVLRVERGDRVRLNLDSVDVEHGFSIDGYDLDVRVPERGTQSVEFIANKAGAYRVRCSTTCGPFHPFMIGKLVVGSNTRFWTALAVTLVAPFATLALGWPREEQP